METKQFDLEVCKNRTEKELNSIVEVRKITAAISENVNSFLLNNGIYGKVDLENSFVCILPYDGCEVIVGLIEILPNDIRTVLAAPPDEKNRFYHEYTLIAMDKRLFTEEFLHRCFRVSMQYLLHSEEIEEKVFWFKYRGQLYSRVIDVQVLKTNNEYTYYFISESEYFVRHLMNELNEIKKQSKRIYDRKN